MFNIDEQKLRKQIMQAVQNLNYPTVRSIATQTDETSLMCVARLICNMVDEGILVRTSNDIYSLPS